MLKSIVLNNNVRSRTHWLPIPRNDHQTTPNPQRVSQFEVKHLAAWCFVILDTSYVVAFTSLQLGTDTNKLTKKKGKIYLLLNVASDYFVLLIFIIISL